MTQMRTTLNVDERLYARAKEVAAQERRSVTSLIEEGLRVVLDSRHSVEEREPIRLTIVGGRGLQAGVDLDDSAALHDLTAD